MSTQQLSPRMSRFSGSPTSALQVRVSELKRQGKNIVSLSVGEPDFDTPDYIKEGAMDAIQAGFTKYTQVNGIFELREAIAQKLQKDNNIPVTADHICNTVGAKQAVFSSLMVLCDEGDEVIIPIPCWVSYTEMVKLSGAKPVLVNCKEDFSLDLDAIEKAVTDKTRAIIICTPNNPTGAVYSEESLRALADLAIKHDFFIIADEIYEKLVYDGSRHFSIASISEEAFNHTCTINGFSKAYAMTGWRLGYVAARQDIIKGIMRFQSQVNSSNCSISQKAGVAALTGPQDSIAAMVEEFARRKGLCLRPCMQNSSHELSRAEGRVLCPVRHQLLFRQELWRVAHQQRSRSERIPARHAAGFHGSRRSLLSARHHSLRLCQFDGKSEDRARPR